MTNTFIDALAQNPVLQDLEININTVGEASASPPAADVVETPEVKAPVIPDNIYLRFNEEEQITQAINENLNIFQINGLITHNFWTSAWSVAKKEIYRANPYVATNVFFTMDCDCLCCIRCLSDTYVDCLC